MNRLARHYIAFALFSALSALDSSASILSTNPPSQPLTAERITNLRPDQRPAWTDYLSRSKAQREADQDYLVREMRVYGINQLLSPPKGASKKWAPMDMSQAWYSGLDGRRIANCIVSFQTPAGGWCKNFAMNGKTREPGMFFGELESGPLTNKSDFELTLDRRWSFVGTFDNNATITQMRFLGKVLSSTTNYVDRYRASFQRGIDYIVASQYPNGGWPQVWPLQGGYHDAITFNDNAMINVLSLLFDVSTDTNEFNFVSAETREVARKSLEKGIRCVLATQIVTDGRRTVWPQQCDMLTLEPCSARNYEMPSLASSESAYMTLFLMRQPKPSPEIIAAVHAAVAWFQKTAIRDEVFKSTGPEGRHLISAPGKGPIWARYYEIGTDRPIFGDRDKSIHDTVDEISKERRNGYAWYSDTAKRLLEHYKLWSKDHPAPTK